MVGPRDFSEQEAKDEPYELDREAQSKVYVYRFGNQSQPNDWISPRRRANGNKPFDLPDLSELNSMALGQSSFGNSSADGNNNLFISVATNVKALSDNGDDWVRKILFTVDHLGKFSVPFTTLFRTRPLKPLSTRETEWLYYDGESQILNHLKEWSDNPYRGET